MGIIFDDSYQFTPEFEGLRDDTEGYLNAIVEACLAWCVKHDASIEQRELAKYLLVSQLEHKINHDLILMALDEHD